ncbi:Fes1-domain-containing protein [Jaminaea rosea]|uniref:Fes1-domain-containing protein n=1 Tax=Jaminaea rosea TaxID=1569628 RepID=A0A316UWZ4_9BASI|nr:Fes1-domain-containing protein [Jaminaea rosea]PWN28433.1 Fes1-domain-containing protein [Jaminaea rosea]
MASNPQMDALLKWSVENSNESGPSAAEIVSDVQAGKRPDLDPKVLEAMMGKSEAQMMTEELRSALDTSRSVDDRETALDNFEMLIESIDNANLISTMKMWQPLLGLLATEDEPRLQLATLWILGTAVQNNPAAQDALLNASGPGQEHSLDTILSLLRNSPDMGVRAKAMYAISGLLGHHPRAVKEFEARGGCEALKSALCDPSINLRRKAAFFITALLNQDDSEVQREASRPLMIGGPAPGSAPSPAPAAAPVSRATGLAPAPNSAAPSSTGPAPYEKPPVTSTAASGVVHPSIPTALIRSGLLQLLLASILPSDSVPANFTQDAHPAELGPDGDAQEARADEDYAEKALRAVAVFVAKGGANAGLDADSKQALKALQGEMSEDGKGMWDWKRLNLDQEEWERFVEGVERMAA